MADAVTRSVPHHEDLLHGVTVAEIMNTRLLTVDAGAELGDAREILERAGVHHLLVEDRGRIVAILSDRDVLRAISPNAGRNISQQRDDDTLHRPVFHVASYHMVTVRPDAPVQEAAAMMLDHRISALPVISRDGRVAGIVTRTDLLRGMLECLLPPPEQP